MRLLIVSAVFLTGVLLSHRSEAFDKPLRPFFETYCLDCHTGEEAEGGLDLVALDANLDDAENFATWVLIHDRVRDGIMPPEEFGPPAHGDLDEFARNLGRALSAAHAVRKGTVLRRLNRREYENTVNDMFGTSLELADMLPADGRSGEFDNVGEALSISMVQMQRYLEAAELVLDNAIASKLAPPPSTIVRASYAETRGAEQFLGKNWLKLPDGAVVFFSPLGYPNGTLREANVREAGRYKVRVTGYAYQSDEPITFVVNGDTYARGAEKPTFGYFSMPPGKPTTIELEAWIPARYMIQIRPWGITDRYEIKRNGIRNYRGPGLAIQHVEIEGPITDEFPSRGHRLIFEGLNRREIPPRNPNDKKKSWYVPEFEIVSTDPVADATPVLRGVATRAFRRPVSTQEVQAYVDLFQSELEQDVRFERALRTAVTAILCSPRFLYLQEEPGTLDAYALASRLSYFLTRTLPDDELLAAAESGRLATDREVLLAQTERLLKHHQSDRFVQDFTDAWLDLRNIDFTNPDKVLFPEFDPFLKYSMLEETRGFFREMLDENLGIRNLVKPDFAMLNNRLAEHYEIGRVRGPEIRRVALPADSVRGGLLGQASVLKVSANGTNTSPVVRGVWVMRRILGQEPPPPPPGVPGVEPDVRGAKTLRELLDKHRNLQTCRSCHEMIDPPGFALESFNPVGGWRERYRSLGDGERVDREVHGNKVRYKLGPPVDASGSLPDGQEFAGFREFREQLAGREDDLTRALTVKLLTFATAREMGFSDRPEIDRIVADSVSSGHGLRDLIRAVVASEIFRSK